MGSLIVVVIALLVISAAATLGPRLGFAAPLLLVVVDVERALEDGSPYSTPTRSAWN